jgi:ActR/RegA family two-component response regulator
MDNAGQEDTLVAEVTLMDAQAIAGSLKSLGIRSYVTTSPTRVIEGLRQRFFRRAIVATELTFQGELLLARLARLPAIDLVAVGPVGDIAGEGKAREAGARVYLSRPVKMEVLARSLGIELPKNGSGLHGAAQENPREGR